MIKVGIVGVSGYSGMTVFERLLDHPEIRITYISANNTTGKISDIWPQFAGRSKLTCQTFDINKALDCDCVFLAVPHKISMSITPELVKYGVRVIDLSGDYRLNKASVYKKWYGTRHIDQKNLRKAVYGLPELYREEIKSAKLVANPGCYPTAGLLGLIPVATTLGKNINSVIIDAKSGTTGAGRKASVALNFSEVNENFRAYKVLSHQHTPEIEQYLAHISGREIGLTFVPHLLPVSRGILGSIYVQFKDPVKTSDLHKIYTRFYKTEPFVRILPAGQQPELKAVTHSNYCDIGVTVDPSGTTAVITCVIDNLVKGAGGQAVQNMNIMYGFNESEGLL